MEYPPFDSTPRGDDVTSEQPPAEPRTELTPARGRRPIGLPPAFVRAVDRVLDALDDAADAVRAAVERASRS